MQVNEESSMCQYDRLFDEIKQHIDEAKNKVAIEVNYVMPRNCRISDTTIFVEPFYL